MSSDILLTDTSVTVQAHSMRVEGEDLEVRSLQRLPVQAKNQPRRALVHGEKDQLIINCERDYTHAEFHSALQVKSRKVPAQISLYSQGPVEKEVARLILGTQYLSRDLLLPIETKNVDEVRDLDSYKDSVGHTLRWVLQRLTAIEQNLGITPPPRPARPDDGG